MLNLIDKKGLQFRLIFYPNLLVSFNDQLCSLLCEFKYMGEMEWGGYYYPQTKSEGYSFGVVRPSIHSVRPSVRTFCLSRTISQYLLVRFNSFLVQMISTMNSRYPISLVKIDPLTLELLPLFKYRQL